MRISLCLLLLGLSAYLPLQAEAATDTHCERHPAPSEAFGERTCLSRHTMQLAGENFSYVATAGNLIIHDEQQKPLASLFYVAYHRDLNSAAATPRPVTFCFNGGPGSASIWLHLGAFGPQRILLPDAALAPPPYGYGPNLYSLLDTTDLVFIDPVSTGYSCPAPGVEAKRFHGVQEDIQSLGAFINLYVTRHGLWDVPKFLMGESYGTFRAVALASHLHNVHYLNLNGIVLISSVLDFATMRNPSETNDLAHVLFLPSYTAAAHYYKRLPPALQNDRDKALATAEAFAYGDYSLALMRGDALPAEERQRIAETLTSLTGISTKEILRQRLRISDSAFVKELLKEDQRVIGRWDCRYASPPARPGYESLFGNTIDPSAEAVLGPFTAAFNTYLRRDLGWYSDATYVPLAGIGWDYEPYVNQFAADVDKLRALMTQNPYLRLFVASGYYDLATPYFATHYTLQHVGLDPTLVPHIEEHRYPAGHMIYLHTPSLAALKDDLVTFYRRAGALRAAGSAPQ